jgi:uncharacterized membrane protein
MEKLKKYLPLHLTIMLFSLTSVFSKAASGYYNAGGLKSPMVWLFLFLMMLNCGIYAIAWQKVIRHFDLNVAYANRTVYLVWVQIWAVMIFREHLCASNILGLILVMAGVLVVVFHE